MSDNYQVFNFDTFYSSYTGGTSGDPFDTVFTLVQPLRNIKRIFFTSIEIPLGFYNIRSQNGTNYLNMYCGVNNIAITLTSANYSSALTLVSSINTAISAWYASNNPTDTVIPTFSVSSSKIVITVSTAKNITIVKGNLFDTVLGFSVGTYTSTTSVTASSNYNLAYDNYFILYFPTVPLNNSSASNQVIHYKIPLTGISSNQYFYFDNSGYTQSLTVTDKSYIMGNLRVQILDRFGCNLTNSGLDWSFSLKIEFNN